MNAINNTILKSLPVVFRKAPDNGFVAFFVDSLNVDRKEVHAWHSGDGTKTHVTNLSFYDNCSKLTDLEKEQAAEQFGKEYGVKYGLKIRDRLAKSFRDHKSATNAGATSTLRQANDKKEIDWNKDETMQKLQIAITAAISAAFSAVAKGDI